MQICINWHYLLMQSVVFLTNIMTIYCLLPVSGLYMTVHYTLESRKTHTHQYAVLPGVAKGNSLPLADCVHSLLRQWHIWLIEFCIILPPQQGRRGWLSHIAHISRGRPGVSHPCILKCKIDYYCHLYLNIIRPEVTNANKTCDAHKKMHMVYGVIMIKWV